MRVDLIFSVVQRLLQDVPGMLVEGMRIREAAIKFCPVGSDLAEVELQLLPGPCLLCGHPRFFVLLSGPLNHVSVHCPECGWSLKLDKRYPVDRLGIGLILLADLLCLGTIHR
jgi:hypothetical protein